MSISLTATGIRFPDDSTQNTARYGSYRNRIINGNMATAQRGISFVNPVTNTYTLDRWVWVNSTTAAVTITQKSEERAYVIGSPPYEPATGAISKSLKIQVTTADTSIGTTDFAHIAQRIEGINIVDLLDSPSTLSFYIRANTTGTFCVSLRNDTGDYSYVIECDYDVANAWQKYVFFLDPLPSAGDWDVDTGVGLRLEVNLACGATYFVGQSGKWYPNKTGLSTSNQTNFLGTVGNTFELTGVQLEKNIVYIPEFESRPNRIELSLCQRYYLITGSSIRGYGTTGTSPMGTVFFPQSMRAIPTLTYSGFATFNLSAGVIDQITPEGARHYITVAASGDAYSQYGTIYAAAEL